ncbi:hypothetical protein HYY75_04745, partial [bacterium]|nr:hypothetical protein [bacterium]
MEQRSGLRELQIVQSLVTLRWVGIPMLLGFGVLATQLLGMTFQIAPVYFLTCLLALMNVYFTIHVAMLSRQLMLHRGHASLKRFLMAVLNGFLLNLKTKGPRAFFALPLSSIRIFSSFYLLVLEALKGLRFNPLSLENVIHTQVIVDLLSITLFVRYTGSAESPVMILAVVPIIVAGAVLGFQKGLVYSVLSSGGYLILCLLINAKLMTHVKFYGPQFGDLSLSPGWSISNFLMLMMALLASSYLAHHLTSVFKERIFYLNQLLELNRRDSLAYSGVSQFVGNGWFLLTPEGVVVKYKQDRLCLIPENLSGKNILDAIPAFRQHGMAYILQAVVSNQKLKNVERVRIISSEGTSHIMSCKLLPILDSEKRPFVLLLTEDASEILYLKDLIEELKNNLDVAKIELGKVTVDSKDANNQLLKSLQLSNDRALEIDYLSQKIKAINVAKTQSDALSDAMTQELEKVKFANDSLREELQYKQMILEETSELLKNTHQLEVVSSMSERRSKTLFKLDNTCLHLFRSPPTASKMLEILDSQKEPSKLLDLPRKNPKVLEPVFSEGRPVVIRAEVRPDSAASVAISNGNCHRLVAYVPIRSGNEIIGMMMLDRYGPENNT